MKQILSLLLLTVLNYSFAQNTFPIDESTKKISFTEVVNVDKGEKAKLSSKAKQWAESRKYVIKSSSSESMKAVGTINVSYPSVVKGKMEVGQVQFDILIQFKDGKYKYDFTNFVHVGLKGKSNGGPLELADAECGRAQIASGSWGKIKTDTYTEVQNLIPELKNNLTEIKAAETKDNW